MIHKTRIAGIITIIGIVAAGSIIFGVILNLPSQKEGYIFLDSKGREVIVPYNPQRIISMAPSITEILYELNVDDRLVGVTDYCTYPTEASSKTSIGGFSTPNLEIIVSLNPDLIIAASWNSETVALIESLGLAIVIILSDTLNGTIDNIGLIGNLTNSVEKSMEIMDAMYSDMENILNKTSSINETDQVECYFEMYSTPLVAGGTTFINDMITKAGAINIFGTIGDDWFIANIAWIVADDPDVIFIVTSHGSDSSKVEAVYAREPYENVSAIKNNRVYPCLSDIYLRQGPRIIMALENMTRYLYPSLFP